MSKLSEKYNLKPPYFWGLFICLVLTFAGIVYLIVDLCKFGSQFSAIVMIVPTLIAALLTIFYVVYGFKVPNNDFVKWILILFALIFILTSSYSNTQMVPEGTPDGAVFALNIISCLIPCGIFYMCGRLKKLYPCIINSLIIVVLMIANIYISCLYIGAAEVAMDEVNFLVSSLVPIVLWFTIIFSYVVRFDAFRAIKAKSEE